MVVGMSVRRICVQSARVFCVLSRVECVSRSGPRPTASHASEASHLARDSERPFSIEGDRLVSPPLDTAALVRAFRDWSSGKLWTSSRALAAQVASRPDSQPNYPPRLKSRINTIGVRFF